MTKGRKIMQTFAALFLIASTTVLAAAGPLDPPAGPVAPTPGPEPRIAINSVNTPGDASSRFRISQPGSYYLPANSVGAAVGNGITIAASDVTVDLMGFTLAANYPAPSSGNYGINLEGAVSRVTICNGVIRNWLNRGVSGDASLSVTLHDLTVSSNGVVGISLPGRVDLRRVAVVGNVDAGIVLSGEGCTVEDCTAVSNATAFGIRCTGVGARVARCACRQNGFGIRVADNSTVTDCVVGGSGTGLQAGDRCALINCTSDGNQTGIIVGTGCTVSGCSVGSNGASGIVCVARCYITGNTCTGNGVNTSTGAGITASDAGNRIDSNTCAGNDFGIRLTADGNLIIRNSCSGNAAGNFDTGGFLQTIGPIITDAGTISNASPWANFEF